MDKDTFYWNKEKYSNNNDLLFGIINDLQQVIKNTNDNLIIKRIGDIITKINFIINENRINTQFIMGEICSLDQELNALKINNINNQEIKYNGGGRYFGKVVNELPEGKGTMYYPNGDRYEGEWRNGKPEGKGIKYWNKEPFKGDRYEGDWRKEKKEGKGIYYHHNGDRYEGEWRNDKREGKGIYYFNDGDRMMGDFYNDKQIGKHVTLTKNGEVQINKY